MRLTLLIISYITITYIAIIGVALLLPLPANANSSALARGALTGAIAANTANAAAEQNGNLASFANGMMAEVQGLPACSLDAIEADDLDSGHIISNHINELAFAAEKATAFGTAFETITQNQLMLVRTINSRAAIKSDHLTYLSVFEVMVLCEVSITLLDRNVVKLRGWR